MRSAIRSGDAHHQDTVLPIVDVVRLADFPVKVVALATGAPCPAILRVEIVKPDPNFLLADVNPVSSFVIRIAANRSESEASAHTLRLSSQERELCSRNFVLELT